MLNISSPNNIVCNVCVLALVFLLLPSSVKGQKPQKNAPPARELTLEEPVKELPSKSKRWALIIGVDQYKDGQISQLRGAANDSKVLAGALVRYAGFPPDQVILLATDQPEERQPTRVNVLRRLSNLASFVPIDGLLLVAFSGHGMERNGQAFLLPSDAQISDDISFLEETAISVARMKERIKAAGVNQVIVLLDACRNDPGGRADAPNNMSAAYTRGFNFDVRNHEVVAFATLYATAIGQRAYEYTEKKQGYFTWALVEGLKGAAANDKGEVTLANLLKFVQENVPKRVSIDLGTGKQQKPFAIVEGYQADNLVISFASDVQPEPATPSTGVDTVNAPAVPPSALLSAEKVLENYVQAIGGKEAGANLQSLILTGSYEISIGDKKFAGTYEAFWKSPDKILQIVKTPGRTTQEGFDGEIAWVKNSNGVTLKSGSQLELQRRDSQIGFTTDIDRIKSFYKQLNFKGKEKIGEREAYVLEATPTLGSPELLYFDPQTGLLFRRDFLYESSSQKGVAIPMQLYLDGYAEVNGFKIPLVQRQVAPPDSIYTVRINAYGIKFNVPIDDTKFKKPNK